MKWLLALMAVFTLTAYAADVTGEWKGTAETENGTIERTFVFKVDGTKLTGETTSEMLGKSTIEDGKVDGDTIEFTISVNFQGNDAKIHYRGKVTGDEIHFTASIGDSGQTVEYVAKRVASKP